MEKGIMEVRKSNKKGHQYGSMMSIAIDGNDTKQKNYRKRCPHCDEFGHKTKRSKRCKYYTAPQQEGCQLVGNVTPSQIGILGEKCNNNNTYACARRPYLFLVDFFMYTST